MILNRRYIRAKVLQSVYAMVQSKNDNLQKEEQFLWMRIDDLEDLHLVMLHLLADLRDRESRLLKLKAKRHLASKEDKAPNTRFINNPILLALSHSEKLNDAIKSGKLNYWELHGQIPERLLEKIKKSTFYKKYMSLEEASFEDDKRFIKKIFQNIIAPSNKLYDFITDVKIGWVDDYPIVNTAILQTLNSLNEGFESYVLFPKAFKNADDKEFLLQLFRKTVLNSKELAAVFEEKTPNWDNDRLAEIDKVLLMMAIAEFLYFPSIPAKVSLNEYIELSKMYSSPKSKVFINGVLDKILKEYKESGKLQKIGRGLL